MLINCIVIVFKRGTASARSGLFTSNYYYYYCRLKQFTRRRNLSGRCNCTAIHLLFCCYWTVVTFHVFPTPTAFAYFGYGLNWRCNFVCIFFFKINIQWRLLLRIPLRERSNDLEMGWYSTAMLQFVMHVKNIVESKSEGQALEILQGANIINLSLSTSLSICRTTTLLLRFIINEQE